MKRNEKKPLGCGICPYKTNSACHLDRHLRIHTGQKPYACDMCSYRATDGGLLKRHKRVHSGEKPFICHICGHKTAQSCSLKDHMAVHTGKKRYSCDLCSFQCSRIGRLRDHQRIHKVKIEFKEGISRDGDILPKTEPGESKNDSDHVLHRCPHCNLEFSEVQYLDRHVTSVHSVGLTEPKQERQDSPTNEAPQPSNFCSLCASPHESSEALEIHIALHVVYRCLKCKSIFETPDELTSHGLTHTNELIFDCNFCDFKCKTRNELRGHGRIHSTQQFKCSTCNFESKSAIEFSQHLLTHTIKEMVICHVCSKKFGKTEELREHMVTHYTRVRTRSVKKMDELKQDGNSKSVVGDSYSCFYCSFKCPEEREVEKHILDMHVPPKHLTEETEDNHEKRENKKYAIMDNDRLPQGEGVPGMLNTSNLCPDSAPKHHPIIKPSISGFASSMGLQMSGHAISMANLHAKRRCLGMQSASSWNLNDEMDSLETKYLAYSFQCGNLQLHSNPREIFSPECKPSWPIVQFNQMYQLFLMGENLNHYANQNFNLHSTGNEKNMAQENRISSREELRSPINEYASASGTSMHTICADCPVERDYAHRNDKNAARIRNSLPNEGQIVTGSRSKVEKITSCVNTRSIQNVPTEAKIYEIKESGRSDGDSVSIDANTKRSRAEKETPLECRVTRSHLRRRTDPTDTGERKFRSFTVGQEENSGDILLSKLRKFFNDSLPKFNTAANSEGNSTPQDCNEQSRKASPAIFTIDLSSDDETTD